MGTGGGAEGVVGGRGVGGCLARPVTLSCSCRVFTVRAECFERLLL